MTSERILAITLFAVFIVCLLAFLLRCVSCYDCCFSISYGVNIVSPYPREPVLRLAALYVCFRPSHTSRCRRPLRAHSLSPFCAALFHLSYFLRVIPLGIAEFVRHLLRILFPVPLHPFCAERLPAALCISILHVYRTDIFSHNMVIQYHKNIKSSMPKLKIFYKP